MSGRSGRVSVEYYGRRLEGSYVVFGDRVTVEANGHTKTAHLRNSVTGAEALARIMLRQIAEAGFI